MKLCKKCGIEKQEDDFVFIKRKYRSNICKSCKAEYDRQWKLDHPNYKKVIEKICLFCGEPFETTKLAAKYCINCREAANKQKDSENSKRYRELHPEKVKDNRKRYYSANRESLLDKAKVYYELNKSKVYEYKKKWNQTNREKRRAAEHNRDSRKAHNGGSFTADDIKKLFTNQSGLCANIFCKNSLDIYHIDHMVPLILGGHNYPTNLQLLCPLCNLHKGTLMPLEWSIRQFEDLQKQMGI
jgi:5-methylcytosine-specific restriction endonuclease McrA